MMMESFTVDRRSEFAEDLSKLELPHHGHGLPYDLLRHFRVPHLAVGEDDRVLADPESLGPYLEIHFDLERITVRSHFIEVDGFEHAAPEALEPARGILERHAGDHPGVDIRRIAQQEPADRPVHDPDTVGVAR